MHHTHELKLSLLELKADLFVRLANAGGQHGFTPIEVAGGHAVLAIAITGIPAAGNQDLIVSEEEEMNRDGKQGAHAEIIQSNEKASGARCPEA
jgi:hypothetical protein